MQPYICAKVLDNYIIADRISNFGLKINQESYQELKSTAVKNKEIPVWLIDALKKNRQKGLPLSDINELIVFKKIQNAKYAKVSWEITERCNYDCLHCYLGEKKPDTLTSKDKNNIFQVIERSGCLWLQITGGEPLLDADFEDIYSMSHMANMLVTISSNGSLLGLEKYARLFSQKPPHRLTISVYGASVGTYESLTQRKGSFARFINGLELASRLKIRTRLSIILTRYNQAEESEMKSIAKKFGFEYCIYRSLSPTIFGSKGPLDYSAFGCLSNNGESSGAQNGFKPCQAGHSSFHINSRGVASICKAVRFPGADLSRSGESAYVKLQKIAKELFEQENECTSCSLRSTCETCPLLYDFYKQSGYLPPAICGKIK